MLCDIHAIFLPSGITKYGGGDSVSEKKLDKRDGTWAYEKYILGWIFNGKDYTLRLLADKIKNPRTASQHQEVHDENTSKNTEESLQTDFITHLLASQDGQGSFHFYMLRWRSPASVCESHSTSHNV